ncbi:unnamed protein product [Lampetra fluviatilis]
MRGHCRVATPQRKAAPIDECADIETVVIILSTGVPLSQSVNIPLTHGGGQALSRAKVKRSIIASIATDGIRPSIPSARPRSAFYEVEPNLKASSLGPRARPRDPIASDVAAGAPGGHRSRPSCTACPAPLSSCHQTLARLPWGTALSCCCCCYWLLCQWLS